MITISGYIRRGLGILTLVILAVILVLLNATPAWGLTRSAESTVNYTYGELRNADFSHKNLQGGVFAAADLRGANFTESDLSNSILTKAIFVKANLTGVNLTNALMDRVSLEEADLTNAILTDAVATSTSFSDSIVNGADFSGAIIDRYQNYLLCKTAQGVNPVTGIKTRDSLGCK